MNESGRMVMVYDEPPECSELCKSLTHSWATDRVAGVSLFPAAVLPLFLAHPAAVVPVLLVGAVIVSRLWRLHGLAQLERAEVSIRSKAAASGRRHFRPAEIATPTPRPGAPK